MISKEAAQRACEAVIYATILRGGGSMLVATEVSAAAARSLGDLAVVGESSRDALSSSRYFGRPAKLALAILEDKLGRNLSGLGTAADAVAKSPQVKDAKAKNVVTKMARYLNQADQIDRHFSQQGEQAWLASFAKYVAHAFDGEQPQLVTLSQLRQGQPGLRGACTFGGQQCIGREGRGLARRCCGQLRAHQRTGRSCCGCRQRSDGALLLSAAFLVGLARSWRSR